MFSHDTKSALWLSHSSLSDYLKCPLAYYYHYVYKDKKTNHKITLVSPALTLGQVVHDCLEELSKVSAKHRFDLPLRDRFNKIWSQFSGIKGGFQSDDQEAEYRERGLNMMQTVIKNPGPISRLAVKLKTDLPHYWLSATDNIILCGRIDWLEYLPDSDSVHIIDFKTGKSLESTTSLQLPIYVLLTQNCQRRPVSQTSYWYLDHESKPTPTALPDVSQTSPYLLKLGKEMLLKKKLNRLVCPNQGCRYCEPYLRIVSGNAKYVGSNTRGQDLYVLLSPEETEIESEIL